MEKEFEVITDIYNDQGRCVKKDVSYFKIFETADMEVESYIDSKGKVINKYCGVAYRDKYYKINIPYNDMKKLFEPLVITGLYSKSTYHEKANKTIKTRSGRR